MSAAPLPPRVAGLEPTLPSSWYRSAQVFALEKERIFCREWLCVAREEQLAAPGAHQVLDLLGESVLLLRNREGRLRAFYNVCRHRGTRLCRDPAAAGAAAVRLPGGIGGGRITCPYHQWTYDFDGRLIAAPHLAGEPQFDMEQFSLYPVGVECWGGFVFVHLTPAQAVPLAEQLGAIPARIARYPLARAAHRPFDPLRGRGQLEGALRELQRVLPLRRRASGAVRGGTGVSRARRRPARLGARHPAPPRRLHFHHLGHHADAARFRRSTRTSACVTRASSSTRICG